MAFGGQRSRTSLTALGEQLARSEELSADEAADLVSLAAAARLNRSEALSTALDETMSLFPRPVRGSVRKILFGSETGT